MFSERSETSRMYGRELSYLPSDFRYSERPSREYDTRGGKKPSFNQDKKRLDRLGPYFDTANEIGLDLHGKYKLNNTILLTMHNNSYYVERDNLAIEWFKDEKLGHYRNYLTLLDSVKNTLSINKILADKYLQHLNSMYNQMKKYQVDVFFAYLLVNVKALKYSRQWERIEEFYWDYVKKIKTVKNRELLPMEQAMLSIEHYMTEELRKKEQIPKRNVTRTRHSGQVRKQTDTSDLRRQPDISVSGGGGDDEAVFNITRNGNLTSDRINTTVFLAITKMSNRELNREIPVLLRCEAQLDYFTKLFSANESEDLLWKEVQDFKFGGFDLEPQMPFLQGLHRETTDFVSGLRDHLDKIVFGALTGVVYLLVRRETALTRMGITLFQREPVLLTDRVVWMLQESTNKRSNKLSSIVGKDDYVEYQKNVLDRKGLIGGGRLEWPRKSDAKTDEKPPRPNTPAPRPNTPAPRPNAPAPRPNTPAPRPNTPAPRPNAPAPRPSRTNQRPQQQSDTEEYHPKLPGRTGFNREANDVEPKTIEDQLHEVLYEYNEMLFEYIEKLPKKYHVFIRDGALKNVSKRMILNVIQLSDDDFKTIVPSVLNTRYDSKYDSIDENLEAFIQKNKENGIYRYDPELEKLYSDFKAHLEERDRVVLKHQLGVLYGAIFRIISQFHEFGVLKEETEKALELVPRYEYEYEDEGVDVDEGANYDYREYEKILISRLQNNETAIQIRQNNKDVYLAIQKAMKEKRYSRLSNDPFFWFKDLFEPIIN